MGEPAQTPARIVFIVGAPRSGTTWLQLLLFNIGGVASANETHLFSQYLRSAEETWHKLANRRSEKPNLRQIGLHPLLTEEEFIKLCRQFADGVFDTILKANPEARLLLEKTPSHVLHHAFIRKVYPEARFIHLVRDPRACIASVLAARSWAGDWAKMDLRHQVAFWKHHINAGRSLASSSDVCLELRYEDLSRDVSGTLINIGAWLGIPLTVERAREIEADCSLERLQSGLAKAPWDLNDEPTGFFRSGVPDSWSTELSAREIRLIEQQTATEMGHYAYRPSARLSAPPRGAARRP